MNKILILIALTLPSLGYSQAAMDPRERTAIEATEGWEVSRCSVLKHEVGNELSEIYLRCYLSTHDYDLQCLYQVVVFDDLSIDFIKRKKCAPLDHRPRVGDDFLTTPK